CRQVPEWPADRKVAIVRAWGARVPRLVAAWSLWPGLVGIFELIGAIAARLLFRLASERLRLQFPVLATEVFDFGFQLRDAPARLSMHALPVTGLLTQFEILAPHPCHFSTYLSNLVTES